MPHAASELDARPERQSRLERINIGQGNPSLGQERVQIIDCLQPIGASPAGQHGPGLDIGSNRHDPVRIGGQSGQQCGCRGLAKQDRHDSRGVRPRSSLVADRRVPSLALLRLLDGREPPPSASVIATKPPDTHPCSPASYPLVALAAGIGLAAQAQAQPLPPQLTYVQPLSRSAVQTVQEHLHQAGDYAGHVDGVWGPDSVVALQRFQQTHGLQVTGQLNQATAATMGLSVDALLGAPPATAPAAAPPATVAPEQVRTVQARLRELGFYRGALDGVWGPSTQEAIARFQQSRGLEANSQLNPATLGALGFKTGVVPAR